MIIGCSGAGKSTFARNLHDVINIPVIHLDQHYHLPNWEEPPKEEWEEKVKELVEGEEWIMDGNYGGTFDIRTKKADTINYLNYSTLSCLHRVIKRTIKYYGQSRPNMAPGCKERFNLEFLHYVAVFNMIKGKTISKKLKSLTESKKVITLKNNKEVKDFLSNIQP